MGQDTKTENLLKSEKKKKKKFQDFFLSNEVYMTREYVHKALLVCVGCALYAGNKIINICSHFVHALFDAK